jgi:hypothetical protein
MATTQETVKNGDKSASKKADANTVPEGFVKIGNERRSWSPISCKAMPLVGALVGIQRMPDDKTGKPRHAFVVRTTRETLSVDGEKNVEKTPVGEEVFLWRTAGLRDLDQYALDTEKVFEVFVQVKGKKDLGGGHSMTTYDIHANPQPKPRAGVFMLAPQANPIGALPQNAGDADTSEIPF